MMITSHARRLAGCAVLALVGFTSCSDGGSDPTPSELFGLISPSPGATVPADRLHLEFVPLDVTDIRASNESLPGETAEGLASGDRVWLFDLLLIAGENRILLTGTRGGRPIELELTVESTGVANPLEVTPSPLFLEGAPATTSLRIEVDGAAVGNGQTQVLVDATGSGNLVDAGPLGDSVAAEYAAEGTFKPRVLVRNDDNVLLSNDSLVTPAVRVVSPTRIDPAASLTVGAEVVDFARAFGTEDVFVLARTGRSVDRLDPDGARVSSIPLAGMQSPSGLAVDDDGNLFVVDGAQHRVFKFLAPNYRPDALISPDGGFGERGANPGQFESPTDCAVQGSGEDLLLFVTDTGNDRIQVFNRAGVFAGEIDGTVGGGAPLLEPRGICAVPGGGVAVLDSRGTVFRVLDQDGRTLRREAGFAGATRITCVPRISGYCVADPAAGAVTLLTADGRPYRRIGGIDCIAATQRTRSSGFEYLLAAADTEPRCDVAPIAVDPEQDGPAQIVQRFLQRIRDRDFQGAREFVHPDRFADYDGLLGDTAEADRVAGSAGEIRDLETTDFGGEFALVVGVANGGAATRPVEFTLRRSASTGRWALTEF